MAPKRQPTAGDMVRSLVVILIPLVIITVLFTRNLSDHPVQVVSYQATLTKARAEAPYPVLAPNNLPPSWRATQAEWVPKGIPYLNDEPSVRNLWQLGFLAPDDIFIALNQGDALPEQFVTDYTREGLPDGTSRVAGEPWERRISPDERTRSRVRTSPAVTTVVVGDTPYEGLEAFAGTLRAE
ncbi:MAG TPA: DUF4245 domain-containing protein [Microlunatus sp.]